MISVGWAQIVSRSAPGSSQEAELRLGRGNHHLTLFNMIQDFLKNNRQIADVNGSSGVAPAPEEPP